VPIVRAANTGVSAVIDPLGRMVAQLGLGIEGVLDAGLPIAIAPTLYSRIGDLPAAVLVALGLAIAVRRRKKSAS
jgi:apolipoprotein N-acyltransferase